MYWATVLFAFLWITGTASLVWAAVAVALAVYAHRFVHVWNYIHRREAFIESYADRPLRIEEVTPIQTAPDQFKRELELVRQRMSSNPSGGLLWNAPASAESVQRETCSVLLGGAAVVLQMAHPFVAFGVKQHSYVYNNIVLRFFRTFEYLLSVQLGDADRVIRAALTVRAIHARVHGTIEEDCTGASDDAAVQRPVPTSPVAITETERDPAPTERDEQLMQRANHPHQLGDTTLRGVTGWPAGYRYSAYDEQAALWVYATLIELSVVGTDVFLYGGGSSSSRPVFSHAELEALYAHARQNCQVWGISTETMPRDWHAFRVYFARMCASPLLCGTSSPCQRITRTVMEPPLWERYIPGIHTVQTMTNTVLPSRLRPALGFSTSIFDRILGIHWLTVFGLLYGLIPPPIRYYTEYHIRNERVKLAAAGLTPSDDTIRLGLLPRIGRFLGNLYVNAYLQYMEPK